MTKIPEIKQLDDLLMEVYESRAQVTAWWVTPQNLFDGEVPSVLIERGEFARVLSAVQSLVDGVYI